MENFDVVIIGGGPSGIIAGISGIQQNNDKTFLMIKEEEKGLVPCGIPYIFHDLGETAKNAMGPKGFVNLGGKVIIDKVVDVDVDEKFVTTESGKKFTYRRLIFATGSTPTIPKFIKGYELEGVYYIKKSYDYIEQLRQKTVDAKNIVVIGGGFIGVEFAEQLAKFEDKVVSLIEMEKYCLSKAFSEDVAVVADKEIRDAKVKLYTNASVKEILGENGIAKGVKLADGREIEADLVIASIGYKPNTELARKIGLEINSHGAIRIDNYLRTSKQHIFAIGDCSQKVGFITGRTDNIMLASTATSEARILGYNLCKIRVKRNFTGTISIFSTEINGTAFASAGAIEKSAEDAGIEYVVGQFADVDRHPGTLSDTSKLFVKLIVSPGDGSVIGGAMYGGKSVGELINLLGLIIQKNVTVYDLISLQVGTHPLLTTAPTKTVLIKAAENAIAKINQ
jgi:NADPH-dependent 2,4-dienoyl-CoA reductase/sulfur reductase-like enzyme